MRAHKALDLLARTQLKSDSPALVSLAVENEKAKAFLEHAISFEFGQLCPEPEHTEFGLDLLSRRMLHLPYETVFFSCRVGHFLAHMAGEVPSDNTIAETLSIVNEHGLNFTREQVEQAMGRWVPGALSISSLTLTQEAACVTTQVTITGHYPDNFEAKWWHISKSVPSRLRGAISEDQAAAEACMPASIVCGLVTMLMGRDVVKVHCPASPAVNAARQRKKRPLINDAYEIKIRPHVVINTDGANGTGRTHASPKMHWRRGHYRKLTNPDRLVPVVPCLVSAAEDAKLMLPNPKDYILPSSVGWQRTQHDGR